MNRFFLFLTAFSLFACAGSGGVIQAKRSGNFEKPSSCKGGPTVAELKSQKEDLFQKIKSSKDYSSSEARDEALQRYKKIIKGKEQSSCPKDAERFIESIAELHES